MRFCEHVPNSLRNKNPKRHIPYLLEKVVFLDSKRLLSPFCRGEKNFFFNFDVMISQMVRNESVRFGRHKVEEPIPGALRFRTTKEYELNMNFF
jgi:hypothetical protein